MQHKRQGIRREFLTIGVLVVAVVVLFHRFLFFGEVLIPPGATAGYPWYGINYEVEPQPQANFDTLQENYITWQVHDDYLEKGYAPHWYPYILGGNSFAANNFATPYSPFKLLNYLFDAPQAWSWAQVIKVFLSGLFMYLSLRALSLSPAAAVIGGLAWMLNWPMGHHIQTTYNEGLALMPMLFFFLLKSFQADKGRLQWAYGLLAAIAGGFAFLGGNIQMPVYMFVLLAAFALFWTWAFHYPAAHSRLGKFRAVLTFALVVIGSLVVGSAQNWPTLELLGFSIQSGEKAYFNKGIEPFTEITFLNPWIYMWRNFEFPDLRNDYWLNWRWNPYIGLFPLLGFGLAVFYVKDRIARFIVWATLAAIALMHLTYFHPIFEVVRHVPGYTIVDQSRFLFVMMFPVTMAAAYGVDWFFAIRQPLANAGGITPLSGLTPGFNPVRFRRLMLISGLLTLLIMAAGMVALKAFFNYELAALPENPQTFIEERHQVGTEVMADYYQVTNPVFAASFVFAGVTLILVMVYVTFALTPNPSPWGEGSTLPLTLTPSLRVSGEDDRTGQTATGKQGRSDFANQNARFASLRPAPTESRSYLEWVMVGVVMAELVFFMKVEVGSSKAEDVYPTTPAIEFLQEKMDKAGIFRIYAVPNTLNEGRASGLYANYRNDHEWALSSLRPFFMPNTPALFGLQDVRGYESVYPLRYAEFLARADGQGEGSAFGPGAYPQTLITHPMLDLLNVRYVLSVEPLAVDSLRLVHEGDMRIYENLNALPRAMLFSDYMVMDGDEILQAMSESDFDLAARVLLESPLPTSKRAGQASFRFQGRSDFAKTRPYQPAPTPDGEARIVQYEPNRVVIEVETAEDAILMLADVDYPGWKAWIDDTETDIFRADYLFRGIVVPGGKHTVEFRFDSAVVKWSVWLTRVSTVFFALGAFMLFQGVKQIAKIIQLQGQVRLR